MINELRLEVQNMEEEARRYKTNVGKALESASSDAANLSKTTEETLVQLETPTKVHQELQQREACRSKAKEAAEKSTPALQAPTRASMLGIYKTFDQLPRRRPHFQDHNSHKWMDCSTYLLFRSP